MTQKERESLRDALAFYGLRFRRWREDSGLTQMQLAQKAGISQSIISHIECGCYLPSLDLENTLIWILKEAAN